MNEVTTTRNANLPTTSNVANPFAVASAGAYSNSIFMKFKGNNGFLAGQEEDVVEPGTRFAADIMNSGWTWTFWWEGEVLETFTDMVVEKPKAFENKPDWLPTEYDDDMTLEEIEARQNDRDSNDPQKGDGWSVQAVLGLRALDGEMEEYTLKLNSGVALNAFLALLSSFSRQYQYKPGMTPIITLDVNKYTSKIKSVGKKLAPVMKIVDWVSEAELMSAAPGNNPDDYADDDEVPNTPVAAKVEEKPADTTGRRGARGRAGFGA